MPFSFPRLFAFETSSLCLEQEIDHDLASARIWLDQHKSYEAAKYFGSIQRDKTRYNSIKENIEVTRVIGFHSSWFGLLGVDDTARPMGFPLDESKNVHKMVDSASRRTCLLKSGKVK